MSGEDATYVLIPGAWHGGWSWRPVAERLRVAGHRAICLTLPGLGDGDDPTGLGLKDAVDHVVSEVERRGLTGVTLVGHSWGGYPLAGAAHRLPGRVSKVVYYAAQVPVRGRSMVDDNPPEAAAMLRGPSVWWGRSADAAARRLFPGRTRRAQCERAWNSRAVHPRRGRSRASPARRRVRGAAGARTRHGSWDHEGMLTHPDEVAKAILNN